MPAFSLILIRVDGENRLSTKLLHSLCGDSHKAAYTNDQLILSRRGLTVGKTDHKQQRYQLFSVVIVFHSGLENGWVKFRVIFALTKFFANQTQPRAFLTGHVSVGFNQFLDESENLLAILFVVFTQLMPLSSIEPFFKRAPFSCRPCLRDTPAPY